MWLRGTAVWLKEIADTPLTKYPGTPSITDTKNRLDCFGSNGVKNISPCDKIGILFCF